MVGIEETNEVIYELPYYKIEKLENSLFNYFLPLYYDNEINLEYPDLNDICEEIKRENIFCSREIDIIYMYLIVLFKDILYKNVTFVEENIEYEIKNYVIGTINHSIYLLSD